MERIKSLDLARGFTVLCISAVHSVLLYSQPCVRDTLPGQILRFIAEGPGAQLFMTYMGISVTLSCKLSWSAVLKRSGLFLLAGYGLNVLKFLVPLKLGLLPAAFQTDLGITDPCTAGETVFLLGDILHFAALALPISYGIYCLRRNWIYAIITATFVMFFAPFFWDHHSCSPVANYIAVLVGGRPPAVFFPLFPWLCYPLVGLATGYWLSRNPPDRFLFIGLTGIAMVLFGEIAAYFGLPSTSFYRTRPAETAIHVGIVLIWLWIWEGLAIYVKSNAFYRLLQFTSRHITLIYFIQWPLICWLLPLFGYQQLTGWASFSVAVTVTLLTLFLSLLILASRREGVLIDR
jgi:uncharacterized membrane protein